MEMDNPAERKALMDIDTIEVLLREAARQRVVYSYSELLLLLGISFTRPKMRSLCKVLDAIDLRGNAKGEPELACLVVREGDNLPGQGWWLGRTDFVGEYESHAARKYLKDVQNVAYGYWQNRGIYEQTTSCTLIIKYF
jgi:hypothetical protein